MNSLTYRRRLRKDLRSKFRLGPKIRTSGQARSGIRVKIHSWSTIHCVVKLRQSVGLPKQIQQSVRFLGQIRRAKILFTPAWNISMRMMEQWLEASPPPNVVRARLPGSPATAHPWPTSFLFPCSRFSFLEGNQHCLIPLQSRCQGRGS